MATPMLKVEMRENGGRRHSKRIRNQGFVPGVIYGHNKETKAIKVKEPELYRVLNRYGSKSTVTLDMNGEKVPTIIKEVQRHITKDYLLHIDFQQLSENEKVKIQVPVLITGKEKVETSSTFIQQQITELDVQCLPKHIPHSIEIDVSGLELGQSITVGDIMNNENIEILNDDEEVIVTLISSTLNEEDTEEEADVPIYQSDKSILDA